MGAVGGLVGLGGGQSGTGFSTTSGADKNDLNNAYTNNQNALADQNRLLNAIQNQGGLQKQGDVYNQYQGIANGQGPNPAQAMLNQATGANVANQAALMAGQRGAAGNVGLMARQAAQTGAGLQQQAVGQGATMQANQSLNAINAAGGMANTMAANQIGQTNANTQAQQNEQSILQGANTANNNIQGQLANTTMQGQQAMIGGLLNSAGGAAKMMADGGMAEGAAFGPQSMFAQSLNSSQPQTPTFNSSNPGADALNKTMSGMKFGGNKSNPMEGAQNIATIAGDSGPMMAAAKGGNVGDKLKTGGAVPGQAKVSGNSFKNDTVKALLSPGEVVIPRSVMQSKNPEKGAADFVRAVMAKKGKIA